MGSDTIAISVRRCLRRHERVIARISARSKSLFAFYLLLDLLFLVFVLHEEVEERSDIENEGGGEENDNDEDDALR